MTGPASLKTGPPPAEVKDRRSLLLPVILSATFMQLIDVSAATARSPAAPPAVTAAIQQAVNHAVSAAGRTNFSRSIHRPSSTRSPYALCRACSSARCPHHPQAGGQPGQEDMS